MNTVDTITKQALLDKWYEIALPYEAELEVCFKTIMKLYNFSGEEAISGNGTIVKHTRGGYIIRTDEGENLTLPSECYNGVNNKCGTRILVRKIKDTGKGKICVGAVECICFNELKIRMISSIKLGDMGAATTVAWGIYKDAPEPLIHKTKRIIKSLRSLHKRFVTFIETPVLENPARLSEV